MLSEIDRQLHVFYDHARLDSFPSGHRSTIADDDALVILDPTGAEVKRYPAGGWHAAGVGVVCGFQAERDDCANCAKG